MLRAFRVSFPTGVQCLKMVRLNPSAEHQYEVIEGQGDSSEFGPVRLGTMQ